MLKAARNLIVAASLVAAGTASAEDVLRGVAALPENNVITQSFLRYVDIVNETGKGVVSIQVIGGPEAIPPRQQDTALRNGVVDIQGGPAGYYKGVIPESDAFTGASIDAATARENGGFDLLAQVWKDKLGAKLLAWNGAGTQYYVYLSGEPELNADGSLNLEGKKLRSAGTYRDWFSSMGAENVMMKQSEVFSALERGVVDGFGWITFASDIGVNRLVNTRVGPAVWQGSPIIMMNDRRFESLSDEAQKVLTNAALALEAELASTMDERIAHEEERLKADGVQLFELEGEAGANHIANAHQIVWDALAAKEPEFAAKIRPLMYPDS